MARIKRATLDELIPTYAENKAMFDDYKKICDEENKQIKELMEEGTYEAGGYKATKSVSTRDDIKEDKILAKLSKDMREYFEENSIIRTKEYIDMDNLESLLYSLNNKRDIESKKIKNELIELLDSCTERKDVVTLRISKVKEKK
jgi:hypothetical protein